MGWEHRGKQCYYYRKRREGDRVVSEYFGSGDLAILAAMRDTLEREERQAERKAWHRERDADLELARMIDDVGDQVRMLVHAVLLAAGFHTHKGQWRRKCEQ